MVNLLEILFQGFFEWIYSLILDIWNYFSSALLDGSKSTSEIFAGWCRMFGSMCFLMATNIVFFKMLLSVVSTVPSFPDVFLWMVFIVSIVKVAKKADEIITRIGLNPAITGNRSTLPGVIAYTVFRTALSMVTILVFMALPNTVFGYNSATNQGVADFTASAQRLTNAYQNLERKKQYALERLVNGILPGFSDYDEYKVTDESGGMNQNWLTAIAGASLTSNKVTPYDVAQWSAANGGLCEGSGSYYSLIPNGGRHYGLTVTSIGRDGKKLVEALQSGKLAIAIMSKGHFTSGGHFIVLRGVTEDGKILVADPASVKRSNKEWDLRIVTGEASRKVGSTGRPFWVLSP